MTSAREGQVSQAALGQWASTKKSSQLVFLHRILEPRWNLYISDLKPISLSGPTVLRGRNPNWHGVKDYGPLLDSTPTLVRPPSLPLSPCVWGTDPQEWPRTEAIGLTLPPGQSLVEEQACDQSEPVINKTWGRVWGRLLGERFLHFSERISRSISCSLDKDDYVSYLFLLNKLPQNLVA